MTAEREITPVSWHAICWRPFLAAAALFSVGAADAQSTDVSGTNLNELFSSFQIGDHSSLPDNEFDTTAFIYGIGAVVALAEGVYLKLESEAERALPKPPI